MTKHVTSSKSAMT